MLMPSDGCANAMALRTAGPCIFRSRRIRNVVRKGNKGHGDGLLGNTLANELAAPLDVLGLLERAVGSLDRAMTP
eukprot:883439-Pleurochrysis_carterae.AAC.3